MKTFDIEYFNKRKNELGEYAHFTDDSTKIYLREKQDTYIEITQKRDSLFEVYNVYYKNGQLKRTITSFPNDFITGVLKEYDQKGNLIKKEDLDKPFTYSWEDIQKYLKAHEVDDIKKQVIDISRHHNENQTTWTLEFNGVYNKIPGRYVITLDGKTGEELEVKLFKGKGALGESGTIAVYDTIYKKN